MCCFRVWDYYQVDVMDKLMFVIVGILGNSMFNIIVLN